MVERGLTLDVKLPEKQASIYEAILAYREAAGGATPTRVVIGERFNVSPATVRYHVSQLRIAGRLVSYRGSERSLAIPGEVWLRPEYVEAMLAVQVVRENLPQQVLLLLEGAHEVRVRVEKAITNLHLDPP